MIGKFNLASDDEIKVITVVDLIVPLAADIPSGYLPTATEIEQSAKENAKKTIDVTSEQIRRIFPNADFVLSSEILVGTPENKIVEAAGKMNADLIIVGSHGYNLWERILLGSVSDSVIRHAHCSVMVIRTNKEQL